MAFFTDTETKVILLRNMRKILRYDVKRGVEGETWTQSAIEATKY